MAKRIFHFFLSWWELVATMPRVTSPRQPRSGWRSWRENQNSQKASPKTKPESIFVQPGVTLGRRRVARNYEMLTSCTNEQTQQIVLLRRIMPRLLLLQTTGCYSLLLTTPYYCLLEGHVQLPRVLLLPRLSLPLTTALRPIATIYQDYQDDDCDNDCYDYCDSSFYYHYHDYF